LHPPIVSVYNSVPSNWSPLTGTLFLYFYAPDTFLPVVF